MFKRIHDLFCEQVRNMLDIIIERTNRYIESMPKKARKEYGQFFTSKETAQFMANMCDISEDKETLKILDPGAGSGILSCALLERLSSMGAIQNIELTCYENDENVLGLLKENLQYCKEHCKINITFFIQTDNYITSQYLEFNQMMGGDPEPKKYDIVIGNPPYMKIPKNAPEATAMPEVCYGAPNLYFLFSAMGLFNLKPDGEMVYIIPRSWTSGAYFKKFREYYLTEGKLEHIHLFVSRDKVFDKEDVLQETIIINVRKTQILPEKVVITSSQTNNDFENVTELRVPYDVVVKETDTWKSATNEWIRIHDIIQFVGTNYGVTYAENSRETFRKQAVHHFRTAAWTKIMEEPQIALITGIG